VVPHCLRDLTRGGLASAVPELATARGVELVIHEERLPVLEVVRRSCDLLGFEPLHLANEGRMVLVLAPEDLEPALELLEPLGASWIGSVQALPAETSGRVLLRTPFGSERRLLPLSGELLPRIC
ncbi:MAG: AIR synthase-related protein, partial [Cyanobacteriota bacterium]